MMHQNALLHILPSALAELVDGHIEIRVRLEKTIQHKLDQSILNTVNLALRLSVVLFHVGQVGILNHLCNVLQTELLQCLNSLCLFISLDLAKPRLEVLLDLVSMDVLKRLNMGSASNSEFNFLLLIIPR